MSSAVIKVGFCVAYDWELLKSSVPRLYDFADSICFSLDMNRRSWSGKKFDFNYQAFRKWLEELDVEKKIKIYEDDFSLDHLSPIENDNRQRTLMAKKMGEGGWHVQVDADEYFFDFAEFKKYLLKIYPNPSGNEKPINIACNWVSLIKKTTSGYLYINNNPNQYEAMAFATNRPEYLHARRNSHFDHLSPFFVLHDTWARGEQELLQKINSWGHDKDFISKESYFNLWKALDEFNYKYIFNFHPLKGETWQQLGYVPEHSIDKVIDWLKENNKLKIDAAYLIKRNNRFYQKIKQFLGNL